MACFLFFGPQAMPLLWLLNLGGSRLPLLVEEV